MNIKDILSARPPTKRDYERMIRENHQKLAYNNLIIQQKRTKIERLELDIEVIQGVSQEIEEEIVHLKEHINHLSQEEEKSKEFESMEPQGSMS